MRALMMVPVLGSALLTGCVVAPPHERIVEREVVDPYGTVVERDQVIVEAPPPAVVEVVPARTYWHDGWHHEYRGGKRYRRTWERGRGR